MHAQSLLVAILFVGSTAPGCGFFSELASTDDGVMETATGEESGTGTGTGAGACTLLDDDYCMDQDTLSSCDENGGQVSVYDCSEMCAGNLNFTCLNVGTGQHGCWCVAPGKQKVYSCTELEDCLGDCGGPSDSGCTDRCFDRTVSTTIRMYGALVHCAYAGCEADCQADPQGCGTCIATALQGEGGGCSLERGVCDTDRNEEDWP